MGGGTPPSKKNVSLRGAGVDLPNVKNDAAASTTQYSPCFHTKKKHGLCCIVLAAASFLTFGKVNPAPLQTDIFFWEGGGREGFKITKPSITGFATGNHERSPADVRWRHTPPVRPAVWFMRFDRAKAALFA